MSSGALYLVGYVSQWAISREGQGTGATGLDFLEALPDGGRLALELGVYWTATALLFALYAWVLVLCRNGDLRDGRTRRLALAFPVLFNAGLLLGRPYQSVDALTYVAHGSLVDDYGINPYARAAAEIAYREETAGLAGELAGELAILGWSPVHEPSPYGALWTWIEALAATLTGGASTATINSNQIFFIGPSFPPNLCDGSPHHHNDDVHVAGDS